MAKNIPHKWTIDKQIFQGHPFYIAIAATPEECESLYNSAGFGIIRKNYKIWALLSGTLSQYEIYKNPNNAPFTTNRIDLNFLEWNESKPVEKGIEEVWEDFDTILDKALDVDED